MRIIKGTIIGAICFLVIGGIIYGLLLDSFVTANSDPNVSRPMEDVVWWAVILTNLVLGLLFTLVLYWSGAKVVTDGLKTGALFGLILTLYLDLTVYSISTLFTLTYLVVDVVVMTFLTAVVGMVVVLTWGKDKNR